MKRNLNITQKLTAASPKHTADSIFTQKVMDGVGKTQIKLHAATPRAIGLLSRLRVLPATMLAAIALVAVAGTAYAISYILPLVTVNVTAPTATPSGRQSVQVFSNECPEISNKKFELKKVAPFGPEKIADIVKAECNLESIRKWADTQFPELAFNPTKAFERPDMTPGKISYDIKRLDFVEARQVKAITPTSITYNGFDEWNTDLTQTITPQTKFIVDHQYKTIADIKPGDAVAYVSITHSTEKNNDDCTPESCSNTQISSSVELMYIVKLDQPYGDYDKFGSLSEMITCQNNPQDYCHTGNTASFELYENFGGNTSANIGDVAGGFIEGSILSHSPQSIVIKTSSGRTVTLNTTYDLIGSFNTTRARDYNTTVGVGDTLQVMYVHPANTTNHSTINQSDINMISVMIEINSKADLTPSTVPNKY